MAAVLSVFILFSCLGGGARGTNVTGTVMTYLTDDMSELFTQVTATIDRIQLVSTGTGTTCDLLTVPTTVNIANLHNVLQLVNVTECPAGPFNRIHIEFEKSVELMSSPTGTPSLCSFVSYKDEDNGNKPDVLKCSGNVCSLDINGAVNVLARQFNKLALDFDLKDFDVMNFGESDCAVTMKVTPLHSEEIEKRACREGFTGIVSRLSVTDRTFDLTNRHMTFSVLYSGITTTDQPGLDVLLERAQADRLKTKVFSSGIDFMNNTIDASKILVKVEGIISQVTDTTFSLQYGHEEIRYMDIDYSNASLEDDEDYDLTDGSWAEVKLYGYSDVTDKFLARKIEIESEGMETED